MKNTRIKTSQPMIRTREAMESLVGEIAALQNQQRLLAAAMDEQIQSIRQHYLGQLTAQNEALDEKMQLARLWAEANPQEFGPARSIETMHGAVGWRTGQPALKTLPGWTFDRVLQTLKSAGAQAYIRVKEEVHKQNLLSDRDAIGTEKFRQLGLRVVQEETFFVEPKLTEVPALAAS
jgi:phage host-nuclease inhibitor protein Gam